MGANTDGTRGQGAFCGSAVARTSSAAMGVVLVVTSILLNEIKNLVRQCVQPFLIASLYQMIEFFNFCDVFWSAIMVNIESRLL